MSDMRELFTIPRKRVKIDTLSSDALSELSSCLLSEKTPLNLETLLDLTCFVEPYKLAFQEIYR